MQAGIFARRTVGNRLHYTHRYGRGREASLPKQRQSRTLAFLAVKQPQIPRFAATPRERTIETELLRLWAHQVTVRFNISMATPSLLTAFDGM